MSARGIVATAMSRERRPVVVIRSMAVVLAVLVVGRGAAAQEVALAPGDSVRVTAHERPGVYELVKISRTRLVVRAPRGEWQIPMESVDRLEVRRPRSRSASMGSSMLVGASLGAVAGVVAGFSAGDDPADCWLYCYTAGEKAQLFGATLGALGGLGGLIIGATTSRWRWQPVATERLTVRVAPTPGGAGLAIRVRQPGPGRGR